MLFCIIEIFSIISKNTILIILIICLSLDKNDKKEYNIDKKDYVICLDIDGDNLTSVELSNKIDKIFLTHSNITFIIGGSDGIRSDIKDSSNYRLSFSRMTFPHGLFRLILLEQIYRSFKILNNESYHK